MSEPASDKQYCEAALTTNVIAIRLVFGINQDTTKSRDLLRVASTCDRRGVKPSNFAQPRPEAIIPSPATRATTVTARVSVLLAEAAWSRCARR